MKPIKRLLLGVLISLMANWAMAAFPERQVRIIVPYPPGGGADTSARLIASKLSVMWQQPVVIENKPGALGAIGAEQVLRAPADGYTLFLHSPLIISTELNRPSVSYRTLRDFKAVALAATSPFYFMASNEATQGDIKQVMAAAAANGDLSYGSHGEGSSGHYLGLRLTKLAGAKATHVPFAGDSPMLQGLLGGHLKTGFLSGTGARQALSSGRVRALAITSKERSSLMPEIPTFAEQGFPGIDRETWTMFFARSGTPQAIIDQISRDMDHAIKQPEVQKQFATMGIESKGGSAADAQRRLEEDHAYWVKMVEEFGALAK